MDEGGGWRVNGCHSHDVDDHELSESPRGLRVALQNSVGSLPFSLFLPLVRGVLDDTLGSSGHRSKM